MGGKQTTTQNQKQVTDKTYVSTPTGVEPYLARGESVFAGAQNALQRMQANPFQMELGNTPQQLEQLYARRPQLQFDTPFSSGFDRLTQAGYSRGLSGLQAQSEAQSRNLSRQLSTAGTGNNSALIAALNSRNAAQTAGARNALMYGALQAQRESDVARAGILGDQNRLRLAESQQGADLLGQIQNAYAQRAQLGLAGRQQQFAENVTGANSLLESLLRMGSLARGETTREMGTAQSDTYSRTKKSFI